jgi:hypothetical protein
VQALLQNSRLEIGKAAEQAAQRKVEAARLAGKAIADENTLLHDQEATLNPIAGGGRATTASASSRCRARQGRENSRPHAGYERGHRRNYGAPGQAG